MKRLFKPTELLLGLLIISLLAIGINRHVLAENNTQTERPVAASISTQLPSINDQEVLRLTNDERAKRGLSPLVDDQKLRQSALNKCNDMVQNNYRGHYGQDSSKPWDFMKAVGVEYKEAAENLAYGQPSSAEVVRQWMASPTHREAILHEYTNVGISTCVAPDFNGKQAIYTVQHFTVAP